MGGAAVNFQLEGDFRGTQLLDHLIDHRERIALVLGAVQDQEHALGVFCPTGRMVAERAVDRNVRHERRTGRAELDADGAAEAVADRARL